MSENNHEYILNQEYDISAKIKVIGVGGGGSNAVNQLVTMDKEDDSIEYWVFNTDSQALANSCCPNRYVLGKNVTKGLGAGGKPESGEAAAMDSYNDIQLHVKGADLVFIAAGEGGGTGTGAAPVVAKAAKEAGALVLAIVTRPFSMEGKYKQDIALEGINKLKEQADAIIVVSNDRLSINNGGLGVRKAFAACDAILADSVKTVTDLIMKHGVLNLDFADVKAILEGSGIALIGFGTGTGEDKAIDAAKNAISSPLLESSIKGARSLLINFTIGDDTSLNDAANAISYITESCQATTNDIYLKFGIQFDASYEGKVKVAIIATNFSSDVVMEDPKPNPIPHFESKSYGSHMKNEEEKNSDNSNVVKDIAKEKKENAKPNYLVNFLKRKENSSPAMEVKEEIPEVPHEEEGITPSVPQEEVIENKEVDIPVLDVTDEVNDDSEDDEDNTIVIDSDSF